MAQELYTSATTGQTLYAIVFGSQGQLWNGTAFETPDASNWANYVVSMSESGTSGVYRGDFPGITAPGNYPFEVRVQASEAPAAPDVLAATGIVVWTGTAEDVTSLTASEIASEVWEAARAEHNTAGSFGEGIASVRGNVYGNVYGTTSQNTGALKLVKVIQKYNNIEIAGALLVMSTDITGTNIIAAAKTDNFGTASFMLQSGTYYKWAYYRNYQFDNPVQLTVPS